MTTEENLNQLKRFMDAAIKEIASLELQKRVEHRYPFDALGDEVLSKAFALAKSVITLIEGRQPEEALGLSRSIVECALNLRWITADRDTVAEKTLKFVRFGFTVKNLWYWWVKKRFPVGREAEDADRYAAEWDLEAETSGAYKHWSGERNFVRLASSLPHPLSPVGNDSSDLAARQTHDYFQPSFFVHCSQPGLDSYFNKNSQFSIHDAKPSDQKYAEQASLICNSYLHDIILYVLYGMNVNLPKQLDCLERHEFQLDIAAYRYRDV